MSNRIKNRFGVTIIELCTAMAVTAILVGIIGASINFFNHHVINQRRKSVLNNEQKFLTKIIVSHLRRSPGVLAFHYNGITYISPTKGDTVAYEFYNEELLKNDIIVPITSQKAFISDFAIEEVENNTGNSDYTLLNITITLVDDFSNENTTTSSVAVKMIKEGGEDGDDVSGWNF